MKDMFSGALWKVILILSYPQPSVTHRRSPYSLSWRTCTSMETVLRCPKTLPFRRPFTTTSPSMNIRFLWYQITHLYYKPVGDGPPFDTHKAIPPTAWDWHRQLHLWALWLRLIPVLCLQHPQWILPCDDDGFRNLRRLHLRRQIFHTLTRPCENKMETTNPKVYTFYGDGSTIIRWLCTSLLFSAIGSDGRSSRAVSPKYPALPKILTLDIQDRQTFLHTNSFTHRHFYTQMLLHTEVFKQRSFYTQAPLDVFTHRPL